MKKSVKKMIIVVMAAVLALPAMAQWETDEQQNAARPSSTFQSTSTMQSSGSSYSTNPMLNADGTATYNAASYAPAQAPSSGPRKVAPPAPEGPPTPVGDGVWALLLIAAAYAAWSTLRRKAAQG